MILSVHIPKTAGSRFCQILSHRYGNRLAQYYGADSERTHPLARRKSRDFDAGMLADLDRAGVKVLHGHFRIEHMAKAEADPSRYWVWLREPVEHTVSHYHFVRREGFQNRLSRVIAKRALTLEEFAALGHIRNFQNRWVAPFALSDIGFVGVSELFGPLIGQLGLRDTATGGNANVAKPLVDLATRRALAATLSDDVALYSEAMELVMRRLRDRERSAGWFGRIRLARLMRFARGSPGSRPAAGPPTPAVTADGLD